VCSDSGIAITPRLESFVIEKIGRWLGLKTNRDKTRIYEVKASQSGLDFLGKTSSWPTPHMAEEPILAGRFKQEVGTARDGTTASDDL
jgi:hypothetical protein